MDRDEQDQTGRLSHVDATSYVITSGEEMRTRPRRPTVDETASAKQWMPAALYEAWQFVVSDLDRSSAILPQLAPSDWSVDPDLQVTASTWWPDGSGAGISVTPAASLADRIAQLADQFQDHEVEALWRAGRPAVWPECPDHPGRHPLKAESRDGDAVWLCPATDEIIARIGRLVERAR